MAHIFIHAFKHSFLDALKLLPFLLVTYIVMELIEHRAGEKTAAVISRSGKFGPLAGGLLGALPQCGFSASGASLYSGRVITLGTLFAIFLSTSDEMIPVMISSRAKMSTLFIILAVKVLLGVAVGFVIDLVFKRHDTVNIGGICESENCRCEEGIFRSALHHTFNVFLFVFLVGFVLEMVIALIGEDVLARFMSTLPIASQMISAAIALIPNCASSVIITELYLEGVISAGAMMSGLLTGAGIGMLVLFRTNKNTRENLSVAFSLWSIGVILGVILDLVNFGALL